MADEHTAFWLALLAQGRDAKQRARLWNGYLGWKLPPERKGREEPRPGWLPPIIGSPDGGWPELTREEHEILDAIAKEHGGYPEFDRARSMDFSELTFADQVDLSGLILIHSLFDNARFEGPVLSFSTRFYGSCSFQGAIFEQGISCAFARFYTPISFWGARFKLSAYFVGVEFRSGASFTNVVFEENASFEGSQFKDNFGQGTFQYPADFINATFMHETSFRKVVFGNDGGADTRRPRPEPNFTGAEFQAKTDFSEAVFNGVPAFFQTTLHEDTDFGGIDWEKAETDTIPVDYAIRAWERLELIMSKLEKPLDRHRFFRLKMRARRRADGRFLRGVNWLFERIADYGWGVERAFSWWLGHWLVASLILLVNACFGTTTVAWWKLSLAALGTGFSNAHAFLFLTASGGYLAAARKALEDNDEWGVLTVVGTVEAVLGPIFLFLLLLTLRNRFRLV